MDVLVPGLTIAQAANVPATVPGAGVQVTLTITDSGQTSYTGASVAVSFANMTDDAVYDGDAAATTGSLSYAAPVLTWTGNLSPGQTATVTYSVTVNNPDAGDKLLIIQASSAATGSSCPPGTTGAPCQLTVPVLTPALTITKTASTATAVPGQTVSYTVTVANSGQVPYTGATFTDDLGGTTDDAAYNGDAAASAGSVSYAAPGLTWTGDLAIGATATITYSVTVHNPDTGNQVIVNTVTSPAAGSNCPAGGADPRCTSTVPVVGATTLTFTVTPGAASATAGSTVHYTITVANSGLSAYAGATFTD